MKISYVKICIVNVTLLVLALLNIFVFNINNLYVIASVITFYVILVKFILGYEKSRTRFLKDVLMSLFILIMLYHILTYVAGFFVGYLRTSYNLSFTGIMKNVLPLLIVIVLVELLRYLLLKKSSGNNYVLIFTTITFIIVDLLLLPSIFVVDSYKDLISLIALGIIPSISKNILLSYLSYKFGYIAPIFYRILLELIVFIVPIFPDFNEYIYAVLLFILPVLIMVIIIKNYNKKEKKGVSTLKKNYVSKVFTFFLIIFMIIVVILTSGMFEYFIISIGSGSMEPTIDKGDVLIVEKYDEYEYEDIEIGDVLIFKMQNKTVVHRVVELFNTDGIYSFITKGDNNENNDNWIVLEENIIGVAKLNIKYIGLPTIWLNELIY